MAVGGQFSVHHIDLLSILLRCNGISGIQKAGVNQMGSIPPNRDHDLFLVQVWLWEVFWSFFSVQPLSWPSPVVVYNPFFVASHNPIEKWFTVVNFSWPATILLIFKALISFVKPLKPPLHCTFVA